MSEFRLPQNLMAAQGNIAKNLEQLRSLHHEDDELTAGVTDPDFLRIIRNEQEGVATREAEALMGLLEAYDQIDDDEVLTLERSLCAGVDEVRDRVRAVVVAREQEIIRQAQRILDRDLKPEVRCRIEQELDRKLKELELSALENPAFLAAQTRVETFYKTTQTLREAVPVARFVNMQDIRAGMQLTAEINLGEVHPGGVAVSGLKEVSEKRTRDREISRRYGQFLEDNVMIAVYPIDIARAAYHDDSGFSDTGRMKNRVIVKMNPNQTAGRATIKELTGRRLLLQSGTVERWNGKTGRYSQKEKIYRSIPVDDYDPNEHDGVTEKDGQKITWDPVVRLEDIERVQATEGKELEAAFSIDDVPVLSGLEGGDEPKGGWVDPSLRDIEHRVAPDRNAREKFVGGYLRKPENQNRILLPERVAHELLDETTIQTLMQQARERGLPQLQYVRNRILGFFKKGHMREATNAELDACGLTVLFGLLNTKVPDSRPQSCSGEMTVDLRVLRVIRQEELNPEHFKPEKFEGEDVTWEITPEQKEILEGTREPAPYAPPAISRSAPPKPANLPTASSNLAGRAELAGSPISREGISLLQEQAIVLTTNQIMSELDDLQALLWVHKLNDRLPKIGSLVTNGDSESSPRRLYEELKNAGLAQGKHDDEITVRDAVLMRLPDVIELNDLAIRAQAVALVERIIREFFVQRNRPGSSRKRR